MRERERVRKKDLNANTVICFEVRATTLCPRLQQKYSHYVHTGPFTKGPPLRNHNTTQGVHNSSPQAQNLYTRGKA